MTLEKTPSSSAFIKTSFIPHVPPDKQKLIHSPSLPKPVAAPAYTRLLQDNLSFSNRRVLNRALSDNTYLALSPVVSVSNQTWVSSNLAPYNPDRKYPPKISYRSINEVKLRTDKSDFSGLDRSVKKTSVTLHSDSSLNKHGSAPTERVSKTNPQRVPTSKSVTCVREIAPNFQSPMPKSSGQSSRSSAAKRSDKKDLKPDGNGRRLNPEPSLPTIDSPSPKKRRPHSADGRQKETTTCSFFYFIRKKKKISRSPSPDTRGKESNPQKSRSRSIISCSSAQSGAGSDQPLSPPDKDRRLSGQSLTSSRIPQPSVTSTQPPSVTSPSATTPLLTPTSPPSANRHQKYTSRSRSKHRRGRRHRTSKRAYKAQPDDRLRHEDLPPHPSISNNTVVVRTCSEPATPHVKPSFYSNTNNATTHVKPSASTDTNNATLHVKPSVYSNTNSCNNTVSSNINSSANNSNNNPTTNYRPRRASRQESSVNTRSAAVSSCSGGIRKDSTGDSALNLKDKSQYSASKTDIEEDSHYQFTTSSSDQQSRRSFRSQSLPSFRGDRLLPDTDTKVISDAEDFEFCPTNMQGPIHLSLCGCGFLGMYHLGVVSCLTLRGASFLDRVEKVAGASAGALMAAVLVTARDKIEESAEHVQNLAKEIRRKPLGALTPGYSFTRSLRYMMEDILPEDAHESAQGKLFVSLTNADTKKNEMLSDFRSRDELIEALVASCYIPVYAGIKLPNVRGKKYIDGGLSDNLPKFETGRTITVSPFDGKSDIGPKQGKEVEKKAHFISLHNQDIQVNMNNLRKGAHAFFPPKRQTLQEYFEKGRFDASRFLIREGLYEINNQPQSKTVLYESSV